MEKLIEMTAVSLCDVTQCQYNGAQQCHAKAITIGDGVTPECDTFFRGNNSVDAPHILAGVGACKVRGCKFNDDLECTAEHVKIGYSGEEVRCLSYH